jgi:CheY-like chemotaxis protein
MQMPEMDGLEATRTLRRIDALHGLPIVAMTANAMQVDRDRCREAGMVDFVSKPIEPDTLWQVLLRWLPAAAPDAPAGPRAAPVGMGMERADVGAVGWVAEGAGAGAEGMGVGTDKARPGVPADADTESTLAALALLPGFDAAAGLRRLMGRPAPYLALLRRFVDTYADGLLPLHTALAAGDPAAAERFAHTLRGVAASIGCTTLPPLAQATELALRDRVASSALAPHLHALAEALAQQTAALAAALPDVAPPAPPPHQPVDAERTTALLAELAQLLRDSDAGALILMQEHEAVLRSVLAAQYGPVHAAMQEYAFDDALHLMDAAAGALGGADAVQRLV